VLWLFIVSFGAPFADAVYERVMDDLNPVAIMLVMVSSTDRGPVGVLPARLPGVVCAVSRLRGSVGG